MKIVTASQMQDWERQAFTAGSSTDFLMEQAVRGLLAEWKKRFPEPGQALFFCGKGHNGNDGLWLAEELRRIGWHVQVVSSHSPSERKSVPSAAIRHSLRHASVWPRAFDFSSRHKGLRVLVDALLGTGASGAPRGVYSEMLAAMGLLASGADFTLSLDIPSGLDPDSGQAFPGTFRADLTLCLGAVKQGLLRDQARSSVGRLCLIPLDLPAASFPLSQPDYFGREEAHELARHLPAGTHKHHRGSLDLWAGSPGMGGAALLCAQAGLRAGAGLVKLWTHPELHDAILTALPEVMARPFPPEGLPETLLKAKAWILGPGIGVNEKNLDRLQQLLIQAPCPVLLDADALTLVAQKIGLLASCQQPLVLTPHRGELERLIGMPFMDRAEAASLWVEKHPSTILVAKGPNTLVAAQSRAPSFNASGNPGMASAGTGDVLAGVIGSLLSQNYAPWDAARLGVYWHGLAADKAVEKQGEQCLNAGDLISHLAKAWKEIID